MNFYKLAITKAKRMEQNQELTSSMLGEIEPEFNRSIEERKSKKGSNRS
jgi:hypothetical protein